MTQIHWTDADTTRAVEIWDEYQRQHDVSGLKDRTAGIDPASGRVWFGDNAIEIVNQLRAEGLKTPLYFVRVGYDYYVRKG